MSAPGKTKARRENTPGPHANSSSLVVSLEDYAARATKSGALYDAATLQLLREHLWELLAGSHDLESAAKLLAPILAARRQLLAETQENPASKKESFLGRDQVLACMIDPELRLPPEQLKSP